MPLALGLITLPEWPAKGRETFYSLDHQFITKGYNSGTARWKRRPGRNLGRLWASRVLWRATLHTSTNPAAVQTCPLGFSCD